MDTTLQSATKLMSTLGLRFSTINEYKQSKFNKEKLPSTEAFWSSHGITLKSKNGWAMAKCIFHDDQHASLGINTKTGGYFCHACDAKGGDVLSAYQQLVGCDFVTAAKALGAWDTK